MPVMFTRTIQDTRQRPISIKNILGLMLGKELHRLWLLRADVSKYRPEVYNSEKSKILKKFTK